ncbi:endonuclease/exonuclease/phosphatase [Sorangium cellulosum]|uniref:Endonuclease/exonuclease/phosphatase n=1 Tax=Sorangium cellulosum TaxID=56 RepID=A0A150P9H2_SORCE|nr:endonuclease/exonuclease/phosphatase [Sorangium cellulosum]
MLASAVLYLLGVVAVWLALPIAGDRWWPATLFLFGPRLVIALPLLAIVPAALLVQRRALVPAALGSLIVVGPILGFALIVVGPILGFAVSFRSLVGGAGRGDLRVASFNTGSRRTSMERLKGFVAKERPDVLALQECDLPEPELTTAFPGWFVHVDRGMCLVSRHRILEAHSRDRRDVWNAGGHGAIVRYAIALPDRATVGAPEAQQPDAQVPPGTRAFSLVNLHLETPREAIEALMHGLWKQAAEHDRVIALRAWESELARQWVDEAPHPPIVVGDLNMPVDSAIYRRFWSGFENAFSRAGLGFGATKLTRWFGIRIDHVLAGPGWTTERAWIGPDLGSDHLPILADLRWTGAAPGDRR